MLNKQTQSRDYQNHIVSSVFKNVHNIFSRKKNDYNIFSVGLFCSNSKLGLRDYFD